MKTSTKTILVSAFALSLALFGRAIADETKSELEGLWIGKTAVGQGKELPADKAKTMQFQFKGDKLIVAGNFSDNRKEECTFTLDSKATPKQINFTPPKMKKAIEGIYELNGDELKVCLTRPSSTDARPSKFESKEGSNHILVVFENRKTNRKRNQNRAQTKTKRTRSNFTKTKSTPAGLQLTAKQWREVAMGQ